MVKIRLARIGRKNIPAYRIVVTELRTKRNTNFIEELGNFRPKDNVLTINKERAEYWMSVGAQPSDTVRNLMIKENILKASKAKRVFKIQAGKKSSERKALAEEKKAAKTEKVEAVEETPVAEETASTEEKAAE